MRALAYAFQAAVMVAGVSVLALFALGYAAYALRDAAAKLKRWLGASAMSALLVVCAVWYGGGKSTRPVSFPRTDMGVAYLVDAGSYATNDLVHVAFTSFLIPQDAMIYLDYWPDGSTNEEDMVTAYSATLAEFPRPLDLPFENAVSNRWYCYTTWTPGPSIHTNGVWQSTWMTDRRERRFLIPIRTTVEVDGETIAPPQQNPKKKENDDE